MPRALINKVGSMQLKKKKGQCKQREGNPKKKKLKKKHKKTFNG